MSNANETKKRAEALARLEYAKKNGRVMATDEQIRMRPTWMLKSMCWDSKRNTFKPGMENTRVAKEFLRRMDMLHTEEARSILANHSMKEIR